MSEQEATNTQSEQHTYIGNADARVSDTRKVWITDGDTTIVGVYGQGTSLEIVSNTKMPFENLTAGRLETVLSGMQVISGFTMQSTLSTTQVWEGNSPYEFTVELQLYALSDTEQEVMKPLRALEYFIAPDVNEHWGLGGKVTRRVSVAFGKKFMYTDLCLKNISMPYNAETDSLDNFVRCTVNLNFSSLTMISKDMLKAGYGLKVEA